MEADKAVAHFRCSGTHRGEWLGSVRSQQAESSRDYKCRTDPEFGLARLAHAHSRQEPGKGDELQENQAQNAEGCENDYGITQGPATQRDSHGPARDLSAQDRRRELSQGDHTGEGAKGANTDTEGKGSGCDRGCSPNLCAQVQGRAGAHKEQRERCWKRDFALAAVISPESPCRPDRHCPDDLTSAA